MTILAMAAAKGGGGKTTITVSLAAHCAAVGRSVTIVDLDGGQGSASQWWVWRGAPPNPHLEDLRRRRPLRSVVRDAMEIAARDVVLIDTPPGSLSVIASAVAVADAVLIPVKPTVFDVMAIESTVDLCREDAKPFAFVLSDVDGKFSAALVESCSADLRRFGPVLATRFSHRQAYALAARSGRSGAEENRSLAPEAEGVWREITGLLEARG